MQTFLKSAVVLILCIISLSCTNTRRSTVNKDLKKHLEQVLTASKKQYEYFSTTIPDSFFPKTFQKNRLVTCKSWDWVSGFYPGTLLLLSNHFNDENLYKIARQKLSILEREQNNKSTHDLGFMMYCSFGNAIVKHPNKEYDQILLNSAKSLSSRYNTTVKAIRSWDSKPTDFLVIIDNMMNLELLFWATKYTGDSSFYNIAVEHANTTLKHHFRDDYSSYHLVIYNAANGEVKSKKTHQGAFDESSWARGQAWGLYGYTIMYRETKNPTYLNVANNIAEYILKNLPEDYIPQWDFHAPENTRRFKDASAGAIIASALLQLNKHSPASSKKYVAAAGRILSSLSSKKYFAEYRQNGGFLLKHSVGHLPAGSEIDVPLTYADYYFIEAVLKYLNL